MVHVHINEMAVILIATFYKVFALTFITDDHFLTVVGTTAAILMTTLLVHPECMHTYQERFPQ